MKHESYKPRHEQQNEGGKVEKKMQEAGEIRLKEMLSASYPEINANDLQEASERVAKMFQSMIDSEAISRIVYGLSEETAREISLRIFPKHGERLFLKGTGEWFYQEKYHTDDDGGSKVQKISSTEAKNIILTYIKEENTSGLTGKFDEESAFDTLMEHFPEAYADLQEERRQKKQSQPTKDGHRVRGSRRSQRRGR